MRLKWKIFQTIYGQWILGGRRDLKSSHSITYVFHWSSLEIGWYLISEGLGSGPLLWLFVPIPSPLHRWSGWWFRKSAYSEKGREEKPLSPRKGYKKSSSTTELFLKDICFLFCNFSLLPRSPWYPLLLIVCVRVCVCRERDTYTHTPWFVWVSIVPSNTPSLGHMNGVWRWHSDTFQLTTSTQM